MNPKYALVYETPSFSLINYIKIHSITNLFAMPEPFHKKSCPLQKSVLHSESTDLCRYIAIPSSVIVDLRARVCMCALTALTHRCNSRERERERESGVCLSISHQWTGQAVHKQVYHMSVMIEGSSMALSELKELRW